MPRFYFDVTDGNSTLPDASGDDLADVREARSSALEVLAGLARQHIPNGDRERLSITVRQDDREVVYVATLTLSGEWKIDPDRGS